MSRYYPEGVLSKTPTNMAYLKSIQTLQDACQNHVILEARAVICDNEHNLIVDLGCMKGIIPKNECAIGIKEGTTRDIAIISKVNKPVCFYVTKVTQYENGVPYAILSRKQAQLDCRKDYVDKLTPGDIIKACVTHLEPFGCFVDVGCGIISLIPIDAISVSRIPHPRDRFQIGSELFAVMKGFDESGKLCLSHKELLGTWEENAKDYQAGETVAGIVRSIESYGIFVELTPNLAGLAELRDDVRVGQQASVYIKSMLPEKMKIKLIIVDSFEAVYPPHDYTYFFEGDHMDSFRYSPDCADKVVETIFMPHD